MANHEVEEQIKLFWNQQQEQIADIDPETTDFKIHSLPLARIKKVMKLDDGGIKFISHDAPLVFAKGKGRRVQRDTHGLGVLIFFKNTVFPFLSLDV